MAWWVCPKCGKCVWISETKCSCGYEGCSSRNYKIFQEREQGKTFREIGDKYNLTKQRVEQIYKQIKQQTK